MTDAKTKLINLINLRESVNYRQQGKPEIRPACRNCGSYRSDSDERIGLRGASVMERTNSRCAAHNFPVNRTAVCDRHQFMHKDRRDA